MGYFDNFCYNCAVNPAVPVVLGATMAASIYVPLKYMPVKSVALALSAISTLDKVKAAAWILGCAYVCMSALTTAGVVLLQPRSGMTGSVERNGRLEQTRCVLINQFCAPIIALWEGILKLHDD